MLKLTALPKVRVPFEASLGDTGIIAAVDDLWFVICGLWFVVCGVWFVVCGLWFVVCGLWFVV